MLDKIDKAAYTPLAEGGIDLRRMLRSVFSRWWLIVLAGIVCAAGMFAFAKYTYVESYESRATLAFTITTKQYTYNSEGKIVKTEEVIKPYSGIDVARYQYYLNSDEMVQTVYARLNRKYTVSQIRSSLIIRGTEIAGIFTIYVQNQNKQLCQDAISVILDEYPNYLKKFDTGLGIQKIIDHSTPYIVTNDKAFQKALFGFLAGAFVVVAVLFVIEVLSNTVRSTDDIRENTNLRLLGSVPLEEETRTKGGKKKPLPDALLISDPKTVSFSFIESFKAIRTKVENISAEKGYKSFVITSTFENEGKTTVAINLACALAQKGKSVLLIDADLRKPSVLKMIGLKEDDKSGLIQIIKDKAAYADSIKFIKPLGIFVMPSGGVSPASSQFLDTDKVKEILEKAKAEFDYVIIDTPPAHVVSDCLVVSRISDALIFTIKMDYAKVEDINETLEEIDVTDIDVVGSIFTMSALSNGSYIAPRRGGAYRYRYKRGYYYYRGYRGYGKYGYRNYGYKNYGYESAGEQPADNTKTQ